MRTDFHVAGLEIKRRAYDFLHHPWSIGGARIHYLGASRRLRRKEEMSTQVPSFSSKKWGSPLRKASSLHGDMPANGNVRATGGGSFNGDHD